MNVGYFEQEPRYCVCQGFWKPTSAKGDMRKDCLTSLWWVFWHLSGYVGTARLSTQIQVFNLFTSLSKRSGPESGLDEAERVLFNPLFLCVHASLSLALCGHAHALLVCRGDEMSIRCLPHSLSTLFFSRLKMSPGL